MTKTSCCYVLAAIAFCGLLVSSFNAGTGHWHGRAHLAGRLRSLLILPQGRLNIIDFDFYARVAERGIPERDL
ncbi:MAG: hypothetical protein ACI9G1_000824 [Pirellulaceae bacterium]|jgi:hypothetical protein